MTYMENRRVLNAEELLEKIFSFMNEMVDTKDPAFDGAWTDARQFRKSFVLVLG